MDFEWAIWALHTLILKAAYQLFFNKFAYGFFPFDAGPKEATEITGCMPIVGGVSNETGGKTMLVSKNAESRLERRCLTNIARGIPKLP